MGKKTISTNSNLYNKQHTWRSKQMPSFSRGSAPWWIQGSCSAEIQWCPENASQRAWAWRLMIQCESPRTWVPTTTQRRWEPGCWIRCRHRRSCRPMKDGCLEQELETRAQAMPFRCSSVEFENQTAYNIPENCRDAGQSLNVSTCQ